MSVFIVISNNSVSEATLPTSPEESPLPTLLGWKGCCTVGFAGHVSQKGETKACWDEIRWARRQLLLQILVRETLGVVIALEIDKHFQNHRKGWSFEKRGLKKPIGFTPYSFRVISGVAEIRVLVRDFFLCYCPVIYGCAKVHKIQLSMNMCHQVRFIL